MLLCDIRSVNSRESSDGDRPKWRRRPRPLAKNEMCWLYKGDEVAACVFSVWNYPSQTFPRLYIEDLKIEIIKRVKGSITFWLLKVESCSFSQADKERTACKAVQIHKMTTIFTQNDNLGKFWVKTFWQKSISPVTKNRWPGFLLEFWLEKQPALLIL